MVVGIYRDEELELEIRFYSGNYKKRTEVYSIPVSSSDFTPEEIFEKILLLPQEKGRIWKCGGLDTVEMYVEVPNSNLEILIRGIYNILPVVKTIICEQLFS